MNDQHFYVRDATDLNLPAGVGDLRWLVYESIDAGLSAFVCACSCQEDAQRVIDALNKV